MIATVGTFDGVHCGHRFLLDRLRAEAAARGLKPLAVTFDRHPLCLVAPERVPLSITSVDEQTEALRAAGVEVARLAFTPELRSLSGNEFVEMLRRDYGVKALMLGFNNHLGSDRSTSPDVPGVELIRCPELPDHARISSSMIRALIANGHIEHANELIGRPFTLGGTVVGGKQLGRTIGFPTANLAPAEGHIVPSRGVYAARVLGYPSVVNIGCRPTVDAEGSHPTIEAHLIGFTGNLYDKELKIEFLQRLRDEKRFNSLNDLQQAIAADIETCKNSIQV